MRPSPFFHFLLYIVCVIVVYAIVKNIGKRVHEQFAPSSIPKSPVILVTEHENRLRVYVNEPHSSSQVTQFSVKVNNVHYLFDFMSMKQTETKTMRYVDIDYNYESSEENITLSAIFINQNGKSNSSKLIRIPLKDLEENASPSEDYNATLEETQKEVVSCHPNGTYTIGKHCIYTPGLMTNLTPSMYETLKKELTPSTKTYTLDFNLDL